MVVIFIIFLLYIYSSIFYLIMVWILVSWSWTVLVFIYCSAYSLLFNALISYNYEWQNWNFPNGQNKVSWEESIVLEKTRGPRVSYSPVFFRLLLPASLDEEAFHWLCEVRTKNSINIEIFICQGRILGLSNWT